MNAVANVAIKADLRSTECGFDGVGPTVGAIQHRDRFRRIAHVDTLLDGLCNALSFVLRGRKFVHVNRTILVRANRFQRRLEVGRLHQIRDRYDGFGRAEVLVEALFLGTVFALQAGKQFCRCGATEAIDRLPFIANREEMTVIPANRRDDGDERVLIVGYVLKLVDQEPARVGAHRFERDFIGPQIEVDLIDQLVVVEHGFVAHPLVIRAIDQFELFLVVFGHRFAVIGVVDAESLALSIRDQVGDFDGAIFIASIARCPVIGVPERKALAVLVEHPNWSRKAPVRSVLGENPVRIAVERAGPDIDPGRLFDAFSEFCRSQLREGDRCDLTRIDSVVDQVDDTIAQHARLSAAGSCLHENGRGVDRQFDDGALAVGGWMERQVQLPIFERVQLCSDS